MNWMLALMKVRNPRQAGGVAAWSAVADMWLHISALLCFADLCGSLLFKACDICWFFSLLSFVFEFSRHLVYHVDSLGFISHIFLRTTVGTLCCIHPRLWFRLLDPQLACLLGQPVYCPDNHIISSVAGSADSGCGEGFVNGGKSGGSTSSAQPFGWITVHLQCRLRYSYIFFSFVCKMTHTNAQKRYWMLITVKCKNRNYLGVAHPIFSRSANFKEISLFGLLQKCNLIIGTRLST